MANEDQKDFNAMLNEDKGMPKMQIVTDEATIKRYGGTEPITAGAFISIAAWASEQRDDDPTPYWRTLKAKGEINPKFPGGVEAQIEKLEAEGHKIVRRGRKNFRYYVEDFEESMYVL